MIADAQWIPKDERRLLTRAEFIFGMKVGNLTTTVSFDPPLQARLLKLLG